MLQVDTVAERLELKSTDFIACCLGQNKIPDVFLYFSDDGLLDVAAHHLQRSGLKDISYLNRYGRALVCYGRPVSDIGIPEPFGFPKQGIDELLLSMVHPGGDDLDFEDAAKHAAPSFTGSFTMFFDSSVTLLKIHRNTWKGIIILYCIASNTIIQYTQSESKSKSIRCIIYYAPYLYFLFYYLNRLDTSLRAIHPMFENTGILA